MNERIRAREVRLIDETGAQMGIVPVRDALQIARERELDLIEVAPDANPPVCRIMDYGKHKYQQAKREREARKRQKSTEVRVIRMKCQIGDHDLQIKVRKLVELLAEGNKVRVAVRFRGREMSRPQMGADLLNRISKQLEEVAAAESSPRMEGRMMSVLLAPKPGVKPPAPRPAPSAEPPAAPPKPEPEKVGRDTEDDKEQVRQEPVAQQPYQDADAEDGGEAG